MIKLFTFWEIVMQMGERMGRIRRIYTDFFLSQILQIGQDFTD